MANFKIYPLNLGKLIRKQDMPIVAFYLTDGVHHVLLDTGGVPADGTSFMPYYQEKDENLEVQLGALGVRLEDIEVVIISHLHWDHMSNNHLFPNAKIYLQRTEYLYACDPVPRDRFAFNLDKIIHTKWMLLDGDEEILDGLSVLHVGGHSPGFQCVIVDTEKGRCALTSDFITEYEQWESDPMVPGDIYTDIIEYYRGLKKLSKACDYIIPGHNYEVLQHKVLP